jgi:TolB-like protein
MHNVRRIPLDSLVLLGGGVGQALSLSHTFAASVARRLASLPGLRVIPPERSESIDVSDTSPEEIGRSLHVTCVGVCSLLECATGLNLRVELIDALSERLVAEEHFLAGSNELAVLEKQAARWIAQELLGPFTSNSQRQQS